MVPELIQLKDLLKISDSLFTYHERLEGMEYSRHVFFEKKNLLVRHLTSFSNAIKYGHEIKFKLYQLSSK